MRNCQLKSRKDYAAANSNRADAICLKESVTNYVAVLPLKACTLGPSIDQVHHASKQHLVKITQSHNEVRIDGSKECVL